MKVCIIGYKLYQNRPEAVSNIVYGLSKHLEKNGVEVVVVTNGSENKKEKRNKVTIYKIAIHKGIYGFVAGSYKFRKRLKKIVDEERPDIIHDFFVISGSSLLITSGIRKRNGLPVKVKSILNQPVRFSDINNFLKALSIKYFMQELVFRFLMGNGYISRKAFSDFDLRVTHNRFELPILKETIGGEIKYLPIGLDKKQLEETPSFKKHPVLPKSNKKRILYFGHPSIKKGIEDVIKAAELILKKSTSIEFYFYFSRVAEGERTYSGLVKILQKKFPRNIYLKIDKFNPGTLFNQFEVLVLPLKNNWSSTSPPMTLLEAREYPIKIVSTDLELTREALEGKQGVYFAEPGNVNDLSDKIMKAVSSKSIIISRGGLEWNDRIKGFLELYGEVFDGTFYKAKSVVKRYDEERFGGKGGEYINMKEMSSLIPEELNYKGWRGADLGAGTGRVSRVLLSRGAKSVLAIDSSKNMLKVLERKIKSKKVKTIESGVDSIPIKNDTVDFVFALRLFEHLQPKFKAKMLRESARILKTKGVMFLSTFNPISLERLLLKLRKSQSPMYPDGKEIHKLFSEQGFVVESIKYDFIIPRFLFRDIPTSLLPFLKKIEELLGKTPLINFGAHMSWRLKRK